MKVARRTPLVEEARRCVVRVADLHREVVAEGKIDTGKGTIQAYEIDGVVVVTAHGLQATRLTRALRRNDLAEVPQLSDKTVASLRSAA